ncbi:hypothetical protein B0H17DRAFT_1193530 [Mycena rosella]|uniref:DDE-1 domain-containing protein n=1 Tax=Mycena rosella TaxID=1033263 RepID=A0AAD7M7X2_MYCRO|nr:hypothetical protein B0H17DRAFT_1193530 [Mycena rosella]
MPPQKSKNPKPVTGPSRELTSRIERLHDLLKHLPDSLPDNPSDSSYRFSLDPERLELGGYFGVAGHALEISFRTFELRDQPLMFQQRGSSLDDLPKMLKIAVKKMTNGERETFRASWIERLIKAAVDSGAKIPAAAAKRKAAVLASDSAGSDLPLPPAKKSKGPVMTVIDNSDLESADSPSPPVATSLTALPTPPSVSNNPPKKATTQTKLAAFGWKPATAAEVQKQWSKVVEANTESRKEKAVDDERRQAEKKQQERELATLRKRRQRERQRAAASDDESESGPNSVNTVLMTSAAAAAHVPTIGDVADLSRPETKGWRMVRNGTKGGVVQNVPSKRVFWFHPFLWALIEAAIRRRDWSARMPVCIVQPYENGSFQTSAASQTLQKISKRRSLVGTERVGILALYPEIVAKIIETLQGVQASGCIVNAPIARVLMLAIIKEARPDLLTKFKCSEKFVWAFLESKPDWTMRKATRAAKHIPDDAGDLCERAFFRLAYTIEHEKIPAKLIINYDQTGVYIRPSQSSTFAPRGSKQGDVNGKDEKRAYTLGIATTADGMMLPLEQVWSGKTAASLPTKNADGYDEATRHGFHFAFAKSTKHTSHFSTLKTMKEWIQLIVKPYINLVIEADPDLEDDQKAIIYIDIYPVHTSEAFCLFVFSGFPNIIIIYVSGNWITPEKVIFSTSYPVLRNASVRACVDLYDWMVTLDGRNLIKQSWKLCVVPGKPQYKLEYETLTSRATHKSLCAYLKTDRILADEIKARLGSCDLEDLPDNVPEAGGIAENEEDEPDGDDTDVSLADVIRDALGDGLATPARSDLEVDKAGQSEDGGGLAAANEEDNIWAYNDQGRKWTEVGAPVEQNDSDMDEDT